ncbi:hypothetical protein SPBR_06339 [Sporothrix brasiliensis 5110]|uniref:Uncharacterized protein n=1 Tax=Sporothrix brasiliensis 5110 TaxID=1398154 RepID=A0A0C2FAG6_9PEZI|nr:uncharacterized protein SPBR_06339 [Sporothrix brasiliensis 5110]KIH88063.1 hypothetical protein SPBR_06339 [Sporothrix brasiliensis 5110]
MALLFIDNSTFTDRRSQRLIRSHSIKGKNTGKVIPARGHRRRGEERDEEREKTARSTSIVRRGPGRPDQKDMVDYSFRSRRRSCEPCGSRHSHRPFSGFEFAYFTTPVPVTETSRQPSMADLYPRTFCRPSSEIVTRWFETVMTDPCVFYCGVAVTAIHRRQLLGRRDEPLDATRHLLQAMRLLRRDLDNGKTREAGTVGMTTVVISLAIRANLFGLRPGGLVALCAAVPELGSKIRRTDAELALAAGTATIFGSWYRYLPLPPSVSSLLPPPLGDVSIELQSVIQDSFVLCSYAGHRHDQLGTIEYQDMIVSILQRLVEYAPLDVHFRPAHLLDDGCQLGFLSFMTTVLIVIPNIATMRDNTPQEDEARRPTLPGLDTVDWATLDHAYGAAEDTPQWLQVLYQAGCGGSTEHNKDEDEDEDKEDKDKDKTTRSAADKDELQTYIEGRALRHGGDSVQEAPDLRKGLRERQSKQSES